MTVEQWSRLVDWPLMAAAGLFLGAYAWPIIDPGLSSSGIWVCRLVSWATWAVFVVDYLVRFWLTEDRRRYVADHWVDLLIIVLPLLRPLRLLRLVTLLRVLNRRATTRLRGRVVAYVTGGSALLAFCGGLAVLDVERDSPDANITTFADAMWWAITTMTTVGYGDHFPTTGAGKLAAAALMLGGIALLGAVTGTLASWMTETVRDVTSRQHGSVEEQIADLRARLDILLDRQQSQQQAGRAEETP